MENRLIFLYRYILRWGDMEKAKDYWQKALDKGAKFDLNSKIAQGSR